MGFYNTATTFTITAKLTPFGRKSLISNNNALITAFALGDSDANYDVVNPLANGQIPAEAGEIGPNGTANNSTTLNAGIRSFLIVNPSGLLQKSVEQQSTLISFSVNLNGQTTISGTGLTQNVIYRNNFATDSLVNLYYSFGLPLNSTNDALFTGRTFATGGYSDTALSALSQSTIIAFGINNSLYGELLDGKQIKLVLPTTAGTYTIYSTFQNKGAALTSEDVNLTDTSTVTAFIGTNIAFLFSDSIQTPNSAATLSWSTGFASLKPFSVNNKQLYNLQNNATQGKLVDKIVGVAYLDKGFIVITDPTIISHYDSNTSSAATVTFNSVSTAVYQTITCIADRGEFGGSTNSTFDSQDIPRISEIGLYDKFGNLIALGKTNIHIQKDVNGFMAFGVKINL